MRHYWALELIIVAILTASLLTLQIFGGPWIVVPIVIIAWVLLQLVSSVAFCNAINKRTVTVTRASAGTKETYGLAAGARPGWLVMRHVWMYDLVERPASN